MFEASSVTRDGRRLVQAVGGIRGLVDGALPPLVFVTVNTVVRSAGDHGTAIRLATVAALLTGLALIGVRLAERGPTRRLLLGMLGLGLAIGFAARSGDARDFFLPGIWVDATYALALAGSAVLGRPILGFVHAGLFGAPRRWWTSAGLRRRYAIVTLGWSAVYAVRAGVQIVLYAQDRPGLLALAKVSLGWPLTVAAIGLSLLYLNRTPDTARTDTGQPPRRGSAHGTGLAR